jgi:hypothetical protein
LGNVSSLGVPGGGITGEPDEVPTGSCVSPDAIIAPPLDGKRKYTHIIVSGRSSLPGIGVVL